MFCWPCILVQSCEQNQLGAQIFLICLLLFSTCFGKLCAHHQEKITVTIRHLVFVTLYRWLAGRPAHIPDSHLYRVTNTRCRIGTVIFSWWWAHSFPKHVEKSNKHIKKNYAPSWFYSQDVIHEFGSGSHNTTQPAGRRFGYPWCKCLKSELKSVGVRYTWTYQYRTVVGNPERKRSFTECGNHWSWSW